MRDSGSLGWGSIPHGGCICRDELGHSIDYQSCPKEYEQPVSGLGREEEHHYSEDKDDDRSYEQGAGQRHGLGCSYETYYVAETEYQKKQSENEHYEVDEERRENYEDESECDVHYGVQHQKRDFLVFPFACVGQDYADHSYCEYQCAEYGHDVFLHLFRPDDQNQSKYESDNGSGIPVGPVEKDVGCLDRFHNSNSTL